MTFVLVPGAGGDGHYWHVLAPLLGPDTVSVTLPAGDEEAGLAAYADAIVAAADGASDITLVAQSLGGFSAPLAVDRLDVRRLVMLNAMVPRPGETFNDWWGAVGQQEAARAYAVRDGRDPDAGWDEGELFFHDVPAQVTEAVYARGEPQQADKPCGEPWPLDNWPDVATSAITSRHDRLFPELCQRAYLKERLGIEPTVIDGGHLVALSNPVGLAEVLHDQVDSLRKS
jgi:thioesterase domain-containing protein